MVSTEKNLLFDKLCVRAKVSRIIMGHGEEGVIKSEMIKSLAEKLVEYVDFEGIEDHMDHSKYILATLRVAKKDQLPSDRTVRFEKIPEMSLKKRLSISSRRLTESREVDRYYLDDGINSLEKPEKPKVKGPEWYVEMVEELE